MIFVTILGIRVVPFVVIFTIGTYLRASFDSSKYLYSLKAQLNRPNVRTQNLLVEELTF